MKNLKFLFICLLVFITGCSEKGNKLNDSYVQYITQYYSMTGSKLIDISTGLAFLDLEKNFMVYACNLPGCTHQPDSKCLAQPKSDGSEGYFFFPFSYDDKLYYIRQYPTKAELACSNFDGSDRKIFDSIPISTIFNMIHIGNKLFYLGLDEKSSTTDDGYVDVTSVKASVFETNLDTGKTDTIYEFNKCFGFNVSTFIYFKGHLYCQYCIQTSSWENTPYKNPKDHVDAWINKTTEEMKEMLGIHYNLSIIDLENAKTVTNTDIDGSLIGVTDNKLFFQTEQGLFSYNSSMEDKTPYSFDAGNSVTGVMLDEHFLVTVWDASYIAHYYLWDNDKEIFSELKIMDAYNLRVYSYGVDKLLLVRSPKKASSSGSEWTYILADKKDFFNGQLNYKEVAYRVN